MILDRIANGFGLGVCESGAEFGDVAQDYCDLGLDFDESVSFRFGF